MAGLNCNSIEVRSSSSAGSSHNRICDAAQVFENCKIAQFQRRRIADRAMACVWGYSYRSATMGSTLVARLAGM
jgi:hypothetical protein